MKKPPKNGNFSPLTQNITSHCANIINLIHEIRAWHVGTTFIFNKDLRICYHFCAKSDTTFAVRYLCSECVCAAGFFLHTKRAALLFLATTVILMLEMCKITTRHSGMLKFTHTIKNFEIHIKHASFIRCTVENDDFLKNSYFSYFRPPKLLTVHWYIHQWKGLLICYKMV